MECNGRPGAGAAYVCLPSLPWQSTCESTHPVVPQGWSVGLVGKDCAIYLVFDVICPFGCHWNAVEGPLAGQDRAMGRRPFPAFRAAQLWIRIGKYNQV